MLGLSAVTAAACNSRFEFDMPPAAGSSGTQAQAGSSGAAGTGGSLAGGSSAGGSSAGGSSGSPAGSAGTASGQAGGGGTAGSDPSDGGGGSGDVCEGVTCPAPLHCANGACAECAGDSDCLTAAAPRCEPVRHRCVACTQATDCPDGFVCDALGNRCARHCIQDLDCPADTHGCDEARLVCIKCDENEECAGSPLGKVCASDRSGCVQCRKDSDCATGHHCDALTGRCLDCAMGAQCTSGFCDVTVGACL